MAWQRKTPFGYQIQNGRITCHPEEAESVRYIFSHYLLGSSYNQIADEMAQQGVRYHQHTAQWNKHMVKRILENERYLGLDGYPRLIADEEFLAVRLRRGEQNTYAPCPSEILPIRDKAVCALCGEKMARDTKSHGRPCWRCKNPECGCSIYLDDSIILELVIQKLKELAKSPERIQLPQAAPASTDALRIENELALCFNRADINAEYMKTLIMAAAAERVFEFLNEPEEDQLADPARRADPACIDGQVTFDHVRFGYVPEKTIIHDFSCNVQPGQKVAIVGPTGAGKTTMVKLLMRFYDVDSGSITLNGHDIRDFDRSALREGFGMVLQDTWLFKGTIMENIRYGRLDATDEEVIAAAKAANADHFIRTLPGGYQMELNEDASNVSQGQKQLLTIARAILADNRILILDEATSSVDTRTEQRIQTAMDNLMRGRTSFVIAHRLSTIRDADLILVMRDGDIVEQGTHDQLIEAGGFYADLYNSQFEDVVD